MSLNICIFGAGAWGSAMAIHLNRCGQRVTLVPRRLEQAAEIASARENSVYLPGVKFPQDIQIAANAAPALMRCDAVIFACPSKALRETVRKVAASLRARENAGGKCAPARPLVAISLCKGLESETFLRPEEVIRAELPGVCTGTLSGPTNAAEVAAALPVAVVFATDAPVEVAERIQREFSNDAFRIYLSADVVGVELGGSLKNIYAIAAGICDGMRLGANARASLLTRALAEMSRIIASFGGNAETVQGLGVIGDLIATATADWSRNRTFGLAIGSSGTCAALEKIASGASVVEGYYATKNFREYVRRRGVPAPILEIVYEIIYENRAPADAIRALMTRDLKAE